VLRGVKVVWVGVGQRDEVMKSRGEMLSMLWFSKANVKERQS